MKGLSLFGSRFLFLCGLLHASEVVATCNESDALLKISYSHSVIKSLWGNFSRANCVIYPSQTAGNSSVYFFGYYSDSELPVDYQTCIKRENACFHVTVTGLPKHAFEISWDGNIMELGPEFLAEFQQQTVTTEMGDACVPVCNEATEALFEYKLYSPTWFEYYRLEDRDGNMVVGCDTDDCRMDDYSAGVYGATVYNHRTCLAKENACYQFVIGEGHESLVNFSSKPEPWPTFSIFYDGDLLYETERWLFKSIRFGKGCTPICDPDTESLVEFFMDRWVYGERNRSSVVAEYYEEWAQAFAWELREHKEDILVSSGIVPGATDIRLTHKQICVPKESCLYFNISLHNNGLDATYSLTLDNLVYSKGSGYRLASANGFSDITNMGQCTVESLCNETEVLFELTLHTQDTKPLWDVMWVLDKSSSDSAIMRSWRTIEKYNRDSHYHSMTCVPKAECLFFAMSKTSQVESYTVKRNGVLLSDRTSHDSGWYNGMITTRFGCPDVDDDDDDGLSGGAIAGIVIASVVVVGGAAAVFVFLRWKQKQNA